jgi:acyl-coenzyme A thioesterase PaaI-like protein
MMPPGSEVMSVEFKVNFLRTAAGDRFVAHARVKRAGKTQPVTEADCFTLRDGKIYAA